MKRILGWMGVLLLGICVRNAGAAAGDFVWMRDFGATWSTPIVIGDRLYVQGQDQGLFGCFTTGGAEVWTRNFSQSGTQSSPVYRNGKIYFSFGPVLYRMRADTGLIEHSRNLGESTTVASQAPVVSDTHVYIGTFDSLFAINAETFDITWSLPIEGANCMLQGGVLYVLADRLYGLNPATGSELWRVNPPNGDGFEQGAVTAGYLAAFTRYDTGAMRSHLHVFNIPVSGAPTLRWTAEMGQAYADNTPPAIDDGRVFATSRAGILKAFALNGNGTPLWTREVRNADSASALPVAVGGKVYIQAEDLASFDLAMLCLDGATGTMMWSAIPPQGMGIAWSQPVVAGNRVFLATDWSGVFAFDRGTATGEWRMHKHNPDQTGANNGWQPVQPPVPDIKVNGGDSNVSIPRMHPLVVTVSMAANSMAGTAADWWVLVNTPMGIYSYNVAQNTWTPGLRTTYMGPLMNLPNPLTVLNRAGLPAGTYTFYFVVDTPMNGQLNFNSLYVDRVSVTMF